MLLFQLLRAPVGSRLVRTDFDGTTLTLGIATTHPDASCPDCGSESQRVHSRYTRHLAEEPAFGRRVRLQMNRPKIPLLQLGMPSPDLRGAARRPRRQACTHDHAARPGPPRHRLWRWAAKPAPGWRKRSRCRPARIPCCDVSSRRGLDHRQALGSSASTTGPGARGNATAPSSSTSRPVRSSTSCPIATPPPSARGWRPIPASSWSAATAPRPTPRRPPRPRPRPSRSPIDGTS